MVARLRQWWLVVIAVIACVVLTGAAPAAATGPGGKGAGEKYPVTVRSGVRYGSDGSVPLLVDIYSPPVSAAPRWAVVLVHGGGWVGGSPEQVASYARGLAAAGLVAFDISYRLATPASPGYPRQIQDVEKAVTWVQANGRRFGARGQRVALMGGSAGAYLADMVGVQHPSQVAAVVSLSGPTDLLDLKSNVEQEYGGQCNMSCLQQRGEHILTFLGCLKKPCSQALLQQASPSTYVSKASPPFFIVNSTHELVALSQATGFAARLRAVHVPVTVKIFPGSVHGFDNVRRVRLPLYHFLVTNLGQANHVAGFPFKTLAIAVVAFVVFLLAVVGGALYWRRRSRIL